MAEMVGCALARRKARFRADEQANHARSPARLQPRRGFGEQSFAKKNEVFLITPARDVAETAGLEPTCRVKPTTWFRVKLVATTSIRLQDLIILAQSGSFYKCFNKLNWENFWANKFGNLLNFDYLTKKCTFFVHFFVIFRFFCGYFLSAWRCLISPYFCSATNLGSTLA